MKNTVRMVFTTDGGSTYTMSVSGVKSNLTSVISEVMEGIISSSAVYTKNGNLDGKKSATLITTETTEIAIA